MGGEYQIYMQDIQIPGCFFDGRNSVADGKPLMSPLLYSKMEGIRRPLINVPELQK